MGTSNRRTAPKTKEWSKAKRQATGLMSTGSSNSAFGPSSAIGSYINAIGGSSSLIDGGGGGGGGRKTSKSSAIGRSVSSAQALGAFLRDVSTQGLDETLKSRGLQELIGKKPEEVIAGIIDTLSDRGATLSEAILRAAEADTLGEIVDDSISTYEELRENWENSISGDQLISLLKSFLANVVFQQWATDMSEKLENGAYSADAFEEKENMVKEFIKSHISFELDRTNPVDIDWQGQEGHDLIQKCLKSAIDLMEE